MKAHDIQRLYSSLQEVKNKKLPIKVSFILSRNMKKLEDIVSDIDAQRKLLIEKYAEKDENGNVKVGENEQVKINDIGAFLSQMENMLEADINIILDGLTLEDIESCEADGYDKLTVDEVGALQEMTN